jgi:hypothetical protein
MNQETQTLLCALLVAIAMLLTGCGGDMRSIPPIQQCDLTVEASGLTTIVCPDGTVTTINPVVLTTTEVVVRQEIVEVTHVCPKRHKEKHRH